MTWLIQLTCIMLFCSGVSHALSQMTAEGSFAANIAMAAHRFAEANSGKAPSSWEDLQPHFSRPVDEVFPQILPTKRYAFLPEPIQLNARSDEVILLVARKPIQDFNSFPNRDGGRSRKLGEPGRYMLTRSKSQGFLRRWLPEAAVHRVFRAAHAALPEPDNEPERQYFINFRRKQIVKWVLLAGLPCGLLLAWWINRKTPGKSTEYV